MIALLVIFVKLLFIPNTNAENTHWLLVTGTAYKNWEPIEWKATYEEWTPDLSALQTSLCESMNTSVRMHAAVHKAFNHCGVQHTRRGSVIVETIVGFNGDILKSGGYHFDDNKFPDLIKTLLTYYALAVPNSERAYYGKIKSVIVEHWTKGITRTPF
ncbi:uncharacterized protein DEA37_0010870 [Paragonimus westermani]|uniref:Uncharacterized protein n=1 Tax=Paragonimus westermani TaxID=34504 RepID=A0A5J4NQF6_9TREM|nr:uncharacterized protein DEA37_0010870 [Paragonimus westermani]